MATTAISLKENRDVPVRWEARRAVVCSKPSGSAGKSENGAECRPPATKTTPATSRRAPPRSVRRKTVLPKTTETVALLERTLIDVAELPKPPGRSGNLPQQRRMQAATGIIEAVRARSVGWVVGTSLGFEAIVSGLGGRCLLPPGLLTPIRL